jgi:hypothetical protein
MHRPPLQDADTFPPLPSPELAHISQKLLGDHLLGMQLGNEPDLYNNNNLRAPGYQPVDFTNEFGQVLQGYQNDPQVPVKNNFVGPSVCCGQDIGWKPEQIWDTGFLDKYAQFLSWISVEQ